MHDVRVRDTARDSGTDLKIDETDGILDTDSVRMPEGSFVRGALLQSSP